MHEKKNEKLDAEILLDSVQDPFSSFAKSDGFSFGLKKNKNFDFRKKRKEEYNKNNEKIGFEDFGFDNILKYNENYNNNNETHYNNSNNRYEEKENIKYGKLSLSDVSIKERIKSSKMEIIKLNLSKNQRRLFSFNKKYFIFPYIFFIFFFNFFLIYFSYSLLFFFSSYFLILLNSFSRQEILKKNEMNLNLLDSKYQERSNSKGKYFLSYIILSYLIQIYFF